MVPPPPAGSPQPYGYGAPGYVLPDAQGAMPAMVLGIVSLVVLPLACCCGVGSLASVVLGILAIVFGVQARNRVNASGGTLGGGGKAMAGIVCGGIAVGLAAILFILGLVVGLGSGAFLNAINNAIQTPTP
jgi:hypothetical protein